MSWDAIRELAARIPDHQRFAAELDARFGVNAAVVISDMGRFSSRSRKYGIEYIFRLFLAMGDIARPIAAKYGGRVYKQVGDDFFIRFEKGVDAVQAVIELQAALERRNQGLSEAEEIKFCVGIGEGRFLEIEDDLWGEQLNEASKLGEDLADDTDVLLTHRCFEGLPDEWKARFNTEEVVVSRINLMFHRLISD